MADAPVSLNPAQLEAVYHLASPCLVLAGAGSGKTRVIVHKIAKLLQSGVEARQIAAITFTNKAAQEMRERAKALIGSRAAKDLAVSTFHALGVRMLRADGERLGLKPQFSILDSDDVLGVLRDAGGTTDAKLARHWQWTISLWKNQGLDSDAAARAAADDDARVAARIMQRYEERLAAYQAVDFDDLIGLPLKLLQRDGDARAKWQDAFRHVLVDEYQDTNVVQYELLKALVGERGLFTAVGDDDQSIYGWRGATIDNLKRLPQDYPKLKVIALEQNYRSTGHILRAANHVIAANPKLFEKKLWSEFGDGEPVRVVECDGEEHEAERAVAAIQARRSRGRPGQVQRLRGALPRQPPGPRVRAEIARGADSVQGLGRAELLRSRRNPRPLRLAAPVGQQRRRPGLPARRDHAQARHRPPDAGYAGRVRRALEVQPVRGAVFRFARHRAGQEGASVRCTSSAAMSTTSSTARATPPATKTRRRSCSAG